MVNIKSFLANLTHQPGVYQMLNKEGKVLYVGKARNLKKRISNYFSKQTKDVKTSALLKHIDDIEVTITHTENEALLLECNLIKKLKPHYNVLFRDDKSFPYILITTDHTFPRIDFYRGSRKQKGLLFGPFPHAGSVREAISLVEKLFRLRICTNSFFASRKRPCLQYQINRCTAPCVNLVTQEEYQQQVHQTILFLEGKSERLISELHNQMEQASKELNFELAAKVRDQLTKLREVQSRQYVAGGKGEADVIGYASISGVFGIQLLTVRGGRILGSRTYFPSAPTDSRVEEIITSFITQHYLTTRFNSKDMPKEIIIEPRLPEKKLIMEVLTEKAGHKVVLSSGVRGERKKWQHIANQSAEHAVNNHLINQATLQERFLALQSLLKLNKPPKRIECFDISHSMGESTVGSCVVFSQKGPLKSDYRRYNIKGVTPGDDLAAMEQALQRRFKHTNISELIVPDVLLIDGGVNQLNIAKKVLENLNISHLFLMAVAKGVLRKPGLETLHFADGSTLNVTPDSIALHLIQQIRDEAHRFAISGHRMQRDKKRKKSTLESIPGVGAKRRRELLRYFGGIQALTRASLDEIAKVPGIHRSLAEKIFAALHDVVM